MAPQRTARYPEKQPSMTDYLRSADRTRERVTTEIVDALETAEEQLTSRLDSISTSRNNALDQLQAEHNTISLAAFQKSRDAIVRSGKGFNDKKAAASLTTENHAIAKLWDEWENIQQKIICLGIEVLGPDSPVVSTSLEVKNIKGLKKRVERASALYDMHIRNQKKMAATIQKQERYVTSIGSDAMKQLKAQQKQLKDRKRKQRQEVCQLAKEMLTQI